MNSMRFSFRKLLIPTVLVLAASLLTSATGSNRYRAKTHDDDDREKHLFVGRPPGGRPSILELRG